MIWLDVQQQQINGTHTVSQRQQAHIHTQGTKGQRTTHVHTCAHLQWSQGSATPQHRLHLARGEVSGPPCPRTSTTTEGGQQVGHTKVRHSNLQRVQAVHQHVGGPQVPVQDAQGVQVQQGSDGLLQQGQDTGQGKTALEKTSKTTQNEAQSYRLHPCTQHIAICVPR